MKIRKIKALWPEKTGFELERTDTGEEYIFIHVLTPAYISDETGTRLRPAGSCICYDKHAYQYLAATDDGLLHDWAHLTGNVKEVAETYGFACNKVYTPKDDRFVTCLMQEAELEFLRGKRYCDEICDMKWKELFIRILRGAEQSGEEKISASMHDAFVEARAQIHMRYAEKWDVKDMAALLKLSPSRFYALYKTIFGISPKHDLKNIRIEHAKIMLAERRYSVREVAEKVGYSNEYYFIRSFKELTGKTPGKYV